MRFHSVYTLCCFIIALFAGTFYVVSPFPEWPRPLKEICNRKLELVADGPDSAHAEGELALSNSRTPGHRLTTVRTLHHLLYIWPRDSCQSLINPKQLLPSYVWPLHSCLSIAAPRLTLPCHPHSPFAWPSSSHSHGTCASFARRRQGMEESWHLSLASYPGHSASCCRRSDLRRSGCEPSVLEAVSQSGFHRESGVG